MAQAKQPSAKRKLVEANVEMPTIPENLRRVQGMWCILLCLSLLLGGAAWLHHRGSSSKNSNPSWQRAQQELERQDLPAAVLHLRAFLAETPNEASAHFLLAQTLRRAGQFEEADDELARAEQAGWSPEAIRRESFLSWLQR